MVTHRLSVMAKQEMGTARAKDKFFDLNGIETQTRSEANRLRGVLETYGKVFNNT